MKKVYLDSAATTQIRPEVITKMMKVMEEVYGNPSSAHSFGRSGKSLVETARKTISKQLHASASEIVFTSGGTEANNLILYSAVRDLGVSCIITSRIEHHAVLHTINALEKVFKLTVKYVKLNKDGSIDFNDLNALLQESEEKTLVSLMHINNETGTILNLKQTASLCKEHDALFHSDTVQSIGHFELNLQDIPVDFLAVSAHKFHGPKGVGFAFIRNKTGIKPLIFGGEQERGMRAGTEAVHNIVGLEEAFKQAYLNLEKDRNYITDLKAYFISEIQKIFKDVCFNGASSDLEKTAYTIVNVQLPIPSEKTKTLLFHLDLKGIACSRGSACQSGSQLGSHVLEAILNDEDFKKPSLRFSFSIYNTQSDIDYVIEVLKDFK